MDKDRCNGTLSLNNPLFPDKSVYFSNLPLWGANFIRCRIPEEAPNGCFNYYHYLDRILHFITRCLICEVATKESPMRARDGPNG